MQISLWQGKTSLMNERSGAYVVELRLGSAVNGSLYRIIPEALWS